MGADGTPNSVGDWPSSYGSTYQSYESYGLIPETDGPSNQGLPPMSSLRPNGTTATTMAGGPNSAAFGPANHTDGVNKALGAVRENV